jgi:hypothetical protein
MKNEKLKLCPADSCFTASGGVFALPPPAVDHIARRAQIPFLIFSFSFFIFNFLFSGSLLGPRLLYEILVTGIDEDTSCQELQQLQDYIKQERLLLKIRLVGKELTLSEV